MYREDGKLAARGRHVKYLPMGRFWDMASNPLFFPLAKKASDLQHAKWLRDPERTKVFYEIRQKPKWKNVSVGCRKRPVQVKTIIIELPCAIAHIFFPACRES